MLGRIIIIGAIVGLAALAGCGGGASTLPGAGDDLNQPGTAINLVDPGSEELVGMDSPLPQDQFSP